MLNALCQNSSQEFNKLNLKYEYYVCKPSKPKVQSFNVIRKFKIFVKKTTFIIIKYEYSTCSMNTNERKQNVYEYERKHTVAFLILKVH